MPTETSDEDVAGPAQRIVAPYGEWKSPITVEMASADSGARSWPSAVRADTWWCESDPTTATVRLIRSDGSRRVDVLGMAWSVQNRSIGYGGRPYLVTNDGVLAFTHHGDQRLYRAVVGGMGDVLNPQPLTPPDVEGVETCYADLLPAPGGDEVWCVREITSWHRAGVELTRHVARDIVAVPLDGSAAADPDRIRVVADGSHDFLSGIRLSPDAARLAWVGWDHPSMPWDSTELMVADLTPSADGRLVAGPARCAFGGVEISVPQVEWRDADTLYAVADPSGWWNLHVVDVAQGSAQRVLAMNRECADALWRVGPRWFGVTPHGVVLRHGFGDQQLSLWRPDSGELIDLASGWTTFGSDVWAGDDAAVVVAGSPEESAVVLRIDLDTLAEPRRLSESHASGLTQWRSRPERRVADTEDGHEVHYVYYPPTSPDHVGPEGEVPPLLVHVHGGPTSSTGATPDTEFDLFCSRGIAVASVDYGGSTGYGREYRNRLRHNWGIVDVRDTAAVAVDLAKAGLADPNRTAVRGGSAGGWTTLACLAFTDLFCAGTVYYPISDPVRWAGIHTHDFESRYVQSLVGTLPDDLVRYAVVSPIHNAQRITSPLVMLQGADDFICPPEQAQCIVDAVAARGLWHRYLTFAGEGHGFRLDSSMSASLRCEAELYRQAMKIEFEVSADPR